MSDGAARWMVFLAVAFIAISFAIQMGLRHPISVQLVVRARLCRLSQHRQLDHIVGVANASFEDGVFEFAFEAGSGTNATLGGKSAAEHGAAVRKSGAAEAALDQLLD